MSVYEEALRKLKQKYTGGGGTVAAPSPVSTPATAPTDPYKAAADSLTKKYGVTSPSPEPAGDIVDQTFARMDLGTPPEPAAPTMADVRRVDAAMPEYKPQPQGPSFLDAVKQGIASIGGGVSAAKPTSQAEKDYRTYGTGELEKPEQIFTDEVGEKTRAFMQGFLIDPMQGEASATRLLNPDSKRSAALKALAEQASAETNEVVEWKDFEGAKSLLDPEWWKTSGLRSIGSGAYYAPKALAGVTAGAVTAPALGLTGLGATLYQATLSGLATRPFESLSEAGQVYDQLLSQGATEEEARQGAQRVFAGNIALLPLDVAQALIGIGWLKGLGKTKAAKVVFGGSRNPWVQKGINAVTKLAGIGTGAASEGAEEVLQEGLQRYGMGAADGQGLENPAIYQWDQQYANAFGGGLAAGLPFQVAGTAFDRAPAQQKQAPAPQTPTEAPTAPAAPSPVQQEATPATAQETPPVTPQKQGKPSIREQLKKAEKAKGRFVEPATNANSAEAMEALAEEGEPVLSSQVKKPAVKPKTFAESVAVGDTVAIDGREGVYEVVKANDPAMLTVKNAQGTELPVGRAAVKPVEAPAPATAETPATPSQPVQQTPVKDRLRSKVEGQTQGFAGARPAMPASVSKTMEPIKRREIVKFLDKNFTPSKVGGVRGWFLGQFNKKTGAIRTRLAEDFPIQIHEVGHFLDQKLGLSNIQFDKELLALGEQTTPNSKLEDKEYRREEGVAEFLRLYLMDAQDAQKQAPSYYAAFEAKMDANPEIHDKLLAVRRMVERFKSQSPRDKILSAISVDEQDAGLPNTPSRLYARVVDQLAPIGKVVNALSKGKTLRVDEDPYAMGVLARGWAGKPQTWIEKGVTDDDFNFVSESLNKILEDVENLDDFRAYVVAKRTQELMAKKGFDVTQAVGAGITDGDVDAVVKEYEKKYGSIQKRLVKFQNLLVEELVKSGVVSAEGAKAMREMNEDYVPFYRFFDDKLGTFSIAGAAKFANVGSPIKRIKGSGRTIIDPIESVLKNTYLMLNVATRNKVGRTFIEFVENNEGIGKIAEQVRTPVRPVQFELGDIQQFLEDNGIDVDTKKLEKVATIFTPTGRPNASEYQLTIMRDGKREYWQVDPEIYRALLFLDEEATATWVKILGTPAQVLRAGAVLSPEFLGSNPVRDQWTAFVNSEYGYLPGVDLVRGTFEVVGKTDLYYKWMASGGAQASLVSMDRKSIQKQMRAYMDDLKLKKETGAVKAGHVVKKVVNPLEWIEGLRTASEYSDTATRLGEFRLGVQQEGMTREGIQRSSLSSRDFTTDFARRGSQTQTLNRLTAFWNAQLQGLDKTARVFAKAPMRTTIRSATVFTLPTIILYLMNRDNPYWEERDDWQKDLFFLVPVPGTEDANGHAKHFIYVPKGHALGMVFGSSVERIMRWIDKEDPAALDGLGKLLLSSVSPSAPIPTTIMPVIENMANYDFFTDMPVVPLREQRLAPADQYNVYTSDTARVIGKYAERVGMDISPRKVDNLISGYGGGLGKLLIGQGGGVLARGAEQLIDGESEAVARPSRGLSSVPFVKAFARDAGGMGTGASVDQFYQLLDKAESVNSRVKRSMEQGKAPDLSDAERQAFGTLKGLRKVDQTMAELRTLRRRIENDPKMSGKEKQTAINEIELAMTNLARGVLGKYPITSDN